MIGLRVFTDAAKRVHVHNANENEDNQGNKVVFD